jgi:hypothetical protein
MTFTEAQNFLRLATRELGAIKNLFEQGKVGADTLAFVSTKHAAAVADMKVITDAVLV